MSPEIRDFAGATVLEQYRSDDGFLCVSQLVELQLTPSLKMLQELMKLSDRVTINSSGSRISPRWGCQPSRRAPTYDIAKFSQKMHKTERIWTPWGEGRGSCPKFYYVDLPLMKNAICFSELNNSSFISRQNVPITSICTGFVLSITRNYR